MGLRNNNYHFAYARPGQELPGGTKPHARKDNNRGTAIRGLGLLSCPDYDHHGPSRPGTANEKGRRKEVHPLGKKTPPGAPNVGTAAKRRCQGKKTGRPRRAPILWLY